MERLFRSAYNDDLGNSSRGLEDVGHQVHNHHHNDLAGGVGTSAIHGDIIGNLDGQNESKFDRSIQICVVRIPIVLSTQRDTI